jgi:hypothetical protein
MRHFVRASLLTAALVCGLSVATAGNAEARGGHGRGHSNFFFSASIGVPLGYYGGYYGSSWYRPSFYDPFYTPRYYAPGYYAPRYSGYYAPRYYAPRSAAYSRRPYGPIYSLGLFPAYVGDYMTVEDRDIYVSAYQRAMAAPIGQAMAWNSPKASGSVVATRDGWAGQRYCREFRQDIIIDGKSQEAYGTACRTGNGDWELVQNQP